MSAEPLIHWPQPMIELLGFTSQFLTAGAIGFRYSALRPLRLAREAEERAVFERATARAAAIGLAALALGGALLALKLPEFAGRQHVSVITLLSAPNPVTLQVGFLLLAAAGCALALGRRALGWPIAALAVIAGALRSAFFAEWPRLVNPAHELAAGFWIGTLFLLLVLGWPAVMGSGLSAARRTAMIAAMVNAFSPLALASFGILAVFGVVTAWLHLKRLQALWTTPYGAALIVKLCVVLVVVLLGARNWRGLKPRMDSEDGVKAIGRSARIELAFATLVLLVTSVLVSLPSPGR